MTRKTMGIASAIVVLTMLAAGLWVGLRLPDDALLPVHWNIAGEADRFAGKWEALLMLPGMTAGVSLLLYFLPALEPKKRGLERSQGLYLASWLGTLFVLGLAYVAILGVALDRPVAVPQLLTGGIGILFLLIGNQLGKSRRMFMVGIRTPWTLANEEVWIRTHRLGGWLMVASGLLLLVLAVTGAPPSITVPVFMAVIALTILVPVTYSFLLWRRLRKDQSSE
ncbi:MAG: SdpI family protein [Sphingomonas sp.]|nr:SdpI family protein [Sphingomonas sp.]